MSLGAEILLTTQETQNMLVALQELLKHFQNVHRGVGKDVLSPNG